jgi:hypothetical protein
MQLEPNLLRPILHKIEKLFIPNWIQILIDCLGLTHVLVDEALDVGIRFGEGVGRTQVVSGHHEQVYVVDCDRFFVERAGLGLRHFISWDRGL